jgi:hypothetical protein
MGKIIDGVFTIDQIDEVVELLNQDKYVTMDLVTAFEAIKRTLFDESELVDLGYKILFTTVDEHFTPLDVDDIRSYIDHELTERKHTEEIMKKENFRFRGREMNGIDEIRQIIDDCEINAQKYDYPLIEPQTNIFIYRTPTKNDFDRAIKIIDKIAYKFGNCLETKVANIEGVTLTIRGKGRFIDINIEGINDRAWVGFDFRN